MPKQAMSIRRLAVGGDKYPSHYVLVDEPPGEHKNKDRIAFMQVHGEEWSCKLTQSWQSIFSIWQCKIEYYAFGRYG